MGPLLEVFEHGERTRYAIFVKAVAPIRAAVPATMNAIDFAVKRLRGDALGRVVRMVQANTT